MSDRFPQYHQMIPNFNNPTPLQQQQQQPPLPQQSQHPQHPQQPDQHPAYPDQNRLWQQQMQQFRPRSGMDINQQQQPQQPQQVQDMFRARHGAQNQPMGPQSQPQFGLGMSPAQMPSAGAMKPLPSNQQQPFPDSSAAQSQPSHMQAAGFANMGSMPNQNPALNAASIPQRNSNLFGMQNGPMNKQLERMLAQQQSATNVVFHSAKLNQQNPQMQQVQQQQQPSQQQVQTEMFSSPALSGDALRRPSPSHPPNIPPQMQAPLQGPQQHPVPGALHPSGMPQRRNQAALQEISERLKAARQNALSSEAELRTFMNQMHTQSDVTQTLQSMQNDLKMKQEIFQQLQRQYQAFSHDGAIANNGRMGPNNVPGQPPWGPQTGPSQNFENGAGMGRGGAHLQNPHQPGPQPPNGMQPNSSIQPSSNNHILASGGVPRQGPTPNPPGIQPAQQLGSPFPGQINVPANMQNKAANFSLGAYMGANPAAAMQQRTLSAIGFPPPLEKSRFNNTLTGFLQKRGLKIDPALLRLNDQQIDLANLHALVINEGGYSKVHENGLWEVIGGRMGFVNFPGSDHEPAKSGPVVAQNLAHVYREYLLDLEAAYIRTWINNAQMRMGNPGMQHGGGPGGLPNGIGISANGQPARFSPQLLQYANISTAELRQRHVPENVIAMVDQLRPQLQRAIMEQKRFQQQVRMNARNGPGMAGIPVDANGMQPPNQGTVMNDAGQPTSSAAVMLRQQMMKHSMMNGAGGMDARFGPFHAQYPLRNLEMTKNAMEAINRMKEDCKKGPQLARFLQANIEIPYDQQAEFNRLLDATYRQAQELDQKLHLLHVMLPSCTQRAIVISNIIATQRQLKSTSQPRYILSLDLLRNLASELQKIIDMFATAHMQKQYARMQQPGQQHPLAQLGQVPNQAPQPPGMPNHSGPHPHPQAPPSVPNSMNGAAHSPPGSNMLNHHHSPMQQHNLQQHPPPAPQQPQQQQQTMQIPPQQGLQVSQPPQAPSPSHMPSSRGGAINLQAPPKRKIQNPPTPSNTAPSPAAAAVSTPAPTNAPTPTAAASSPAAPKSPKGKAKAKQTTSKRKMSTAPNVPAAPSSAPAPAPTQAPQESAPSQPPIMNGSGKRPREEDPPSGNVVPSPAGAVVDQPSPPKRSKVEWGEGPQSEELQQKKGQIENVKTEEDTSQFLEEFIKIVGGDPVRDTNGFAELSMLLKECTQHGPADDLSSFPPLEPPPMMKDELEQYFDFSLGGEDDDSKTPELVSSSSTTDTSPGSNSGNEPSSEGAATSISNEIKKDESLDFAHLGLWSGVDGGESAYYQTSDWRFDSSMPTQDPWAISTS